MRQTLEHRERTSSSGRYAPLPTGSSLLKNILKVESEPRVIITGDVRLHVTELDAARKAVKGHYTLETDGMQSPMHVIWMIDGHMLTESDHDIEITFDVRGKPVGETLTRQLTVQVTEKEGQGCIV